MTMKRVLLAAAAASVLAAPAARANDGFGGLTAAGLRFDQAPSVQMLSEDLFIGLDKIKVAYVFRHSGDEDLTGEVIFPLPPISLEEIYNAEFAIPREELDRENLVGFTAKVDGRAVPVRTDRIAVIEPPYDENRKPAAAYETPGTDVTQTLARHGVPLSLDYEKVQRALASLPQPAKDELEAAGIAQFSDEAPTPLWSIIERYHWTQTFPTGKDVRIEHAYRAAPPGGIFTWAEPGSPDHEYADEIAKRYCVDKGTDQAIRKALRKDPSDPPVWVGMAYFSDYVLTTANTWAGPIGDFRLTIDKGDARNVLSLCASDVKKIGPTTFRIERKNFTPDRDLEMIIVKGFDEEP